jgi:riboflavin synthase
MFTGIIREIGTVQNFSKTLKIKAEKVLTDKGIGDSIAVNGACLTIVDLGKDWFETEVMEETLKLTNLGDIKEGSPVNLEPAAKIGDSLDGHFVTGHVDTTGQVLKSGETLEIEFPENFGKYMAWKGPITLNGVNLTITNLSANTLETKLIPHTLENTNLGELKKGDKVNIEVDILARYIEKMIKHKDQEATYQFLKERNLI